MQRTTVRLADTLLEEARREARKRGETVTSLIEKGLRLVLAERRPASRRRVKLITSKAGGGVLPGIDLNSGAGLMEILEPPEQAGRRR